MMLHSQPTPIRQRTFRVRRESRPEKFRSLNSRSHTKAALVTLCLSHLPFHPSCFLGYGAAILGTRYELDVLDLNAELYFRNGRKLRHILDAMDQAQIVSDHAFLYPFYHELDTRIDRHYKAVPWDKYGIVYVTNPSWFPMVPTQAVLRLSRAIKQVSSETRIFFFSNSLGSWTKEVQLQKHGVQTAHLNDLFDIHASAKPVGYDLLPTPVYEHREKYLFDLLPFTLKHGCPWGRCRFCSLSRGWNSGYLERSAHSVIRELEALIHQYDPAGLVCRDHAMNGGNLIEFCGYLEGLKKRWCGQSRADLTEKEIQTLWKAGCREIFFGLESGSDRTLAAMNKGITSKQMSRFVKRLHGTGILPVPSLIIGAPGETTPDFEKTIQFLADHGSCFEFVNVYPFMPTPGSEYRSEKKQPDRNTLGRLFRLFQTCEDLGLRVCAGEQAIEYSLFTWFHRRVLSAS